MLFSFVFWQEEACDSWLTEDDPLIQFNNLRRKELLEVRTFLELSTMDAETLNSILTLNNISTQINRFIPIVLLLFGLTGNALSCLVFLQRALRTNPCTWYFLAASLSNMAFLTTVLPTMLGAWNEDWNLMNSVGGFCKLTVFVLLISRSLSLWLIVLATIDRYLASSSDARRRQMRSSKQAARWIIITCVVSVAVWAESIYCFDTNLFNTPIPCYTRSVECRFYNDITLALFTIIFPSVTMLVFGLLTINNIHQSKRLIQPSNTAKNISQRRSRKLERHLTRMLLLQVLLIVAFNLPNAGHVLYLNITFYQEKTSLQRVTDGFTFNSLLLLPFISCCISFYVHTLSGSVFRQTLRQVFQRLLRGQRIHPGSQQ